MATKHTDHEIRTRIDTFLAELSELVRMAALGSVHAVLSGEPAPVQRRVPGRPRGPGRPSKTARRTQRAVARTGKRVRRSAADLEKIATRVLTYVKSNAGHRLEQIGKALQTDTGVLKRPIANLIAAKKLRTKGQKRGTMYFAGGSRGAGQSPRKSKPQRRGKAKGALRAKTVRRSPRKKAARRAPPRIVRPVRGPRSRFSRKPARATRSRTRAVADALALQAAVVPGAPL